MTVQFRLQKIAVSADSSSMGKLALVPSDLSVPTPRERPSIDDARFFQTSHEIPTSDALGSGSLYDQTSSENSLPTLSNPGEESERRYVGHFRRSIVPLLMVWACGFLILGATLAHGDVRQLFLDPAYANGGPWWTGLVSQIGVLAWTTAAASAAWASWIARHTGRKQAGAFLFRGAMASVILLLDDLLGVHSMFWALGPLGKPFGLTLVLAPVAAWFWTYRSDIVRTRWLLLVAAFLANGASVLVDTLGGGSISDHAALFEDGPKFLGILAWATYFIATTYDIARSALRSALPGAPSDH